jgi:DNA mismatch endonuclease, patch repair protein
LVDIVTPAKRSEMMAGIRAKNTKPEMRVRSILHRLGYRFSLHRKNLPGKPDIVMPKYKTVVLVHGCFWHGHDDCPLFRLPKSKPDFWNTKIRQNKSRDHANLEALEASQWRTIVLWECSLKGSGKISVEEIAASLKAHLQGYSVRTEIRGWTLSDIRKAGHLLVNRDAPTKDAVRRQDFEDGEE